MNHCIFAGYVSLAPSKKIYMKNDPSAYYCKILLRMIARNADGSFRHDYVKLFGWGKMADIIDERVTKGSKICVRCIARETRYTNEIGRVSSYIIFVIRELDVISYADMPEFFDDYKDSVFGDDIDEALDSCIPGESRIEQILSERANSSLKAFEGVDKFIDELGKDKSGIGDFLK